MCYHLDKYFMLLSLEYVTTHRSESTFIITQTHLWISVINNIVNHYTASL